MQPRSKVQHRLKQLIFRHLQKQLRANFKKGAETCRHNVPEDLGDGSWIGRCGLVQPDGKPRNIICDARLDQDGVAKGCPLWEPLQSKEEIRGAFEKVVRDPDLGVVAAEYPDIAALRWVLSESAEGEADAHDDLPTAEDLAAVKAEDPPESDGAWWQRGILGKVFGTKDRE